MKINRKRRHLVQIMMRASGRDSIGQPNLAGVQFAEVWADVRHLNGMETIKGDAVVSIVPASIRIDYLPGVTAEMWVLHEGRTYAIKTVHPDPTERRYQDLVAETGGKRA